VDHRSAPLVGHDCMPIHSRLVALSSNTRTAKSEVYRPTMKEPKASIVKDCLNYSIMSTIGYAGVRYGCTDKALYNKYTGVVIKLVMIRCAGTFCSTLDRVDQEFEQPDWRHGLEIWKTQRSYQQYKLPSTQH
jgi:hypothetical protein